MQNDECGKRSPAYHSVGYGKWDRGGGFFFGGGGRGGGGGGGDDYNHYFPAWNYNNISYGYFIDPMGIFFPMTNSCRCLPQGKPAATESRYANPH